MARELRITLVSDLTYNELKNISQNLGKTLTDFMKPELRKICDSYPEKMKQEYKKVVISHDAKEIEQATLIAEMCMPCKKEIYSRIYRNTLQVLTEIKYKKKSI